MNNSSQENSEENVENKSAKSENKDELKMAQKDFVEQNSDQYGLEFLKTLRENNNFALEKFRAFLDDNYPTLANKYKDNNDTDLNKNLKSQLKNVITEKMMPQQNFVDKINEDFDTEYSLNNKQKSKIDEKLKKMSIRELKFLMNNDTALKKFLTTNDIVENSAEAKKLKKIDIDNKQEDFLKDFGIDKNKLTDKQLDNVFLIAKKYLGHSMGSILPEDISMFFTILKPESRSKFLRFFIKNLSYKQLVDYGIFDRQEIRKKIKEETVIFHNKNFPDDDAITINDVSDSLVNNLGTENFFYNSDVLTDSQLDNFFLKKETVNSIGTMVPKGGLVEDLAEKIADNINLTCEEKRSEIGSNDPIYKEVLPDDENNIHKSFIEFIRNKSDEEISPEIKKNIHLFEEGNFFTLTPKDKEKNYGKSYFEINRTDLGTGNPNERMIVLKNITAVGGIRDDFNKTSIESPKQKFEQTYYHDFYDMLKNFSSKDSEFDIDFSSKKEFEEKPLDKIPENTDEINNMGDLLKRIDNNLTSVGAGIDFKDLVIKQLGADGHQGDMIFEALSCDDKTKTITVRGGDQISKISYSDFYKLFEKYPNRFVRDRKFKDMGEVLSKLGSNFDNIKVQETNDDNEAKLVDKDTKTKYSMLVNTSKHMFIDIHSLSGDKVEYTLGKYKDDKGKDGIKRKKIDKPKYKTSNLNKLYEDIKKYKLTPDPDIEAILEDEKKKNKEEENNEVVGSKFHKLKGFLQGASFLEIGMALKKIPEVMQESLKRGNELKSAKMAQAMGKYLGDTIHFELKAQVAEIENKTIEGLVSQRKRLGSGDMYKILFEIYKRKNTEKYEVEAAMITLLEKAGTLYPKDRFKDLRDEFGWYKKLGGKKGDTFYNEVKTQCEEAVSSTTGKPEPIIFTEERLVENLLKKQDKNDTGRPRGDKAFAKAKNTGIEDQIETGKNKSSGMTTLSGRISYVMDLFQNGENAEGIGGLKPIISKHGGAADSHSVFFVLAASGITEGFDELLIGKLKSLAFTSSYPEIYFACSMNGIGQFRNLVKRAIELKFPENKAVLKEFEDAIGGKSTDNAGKLNKFWDNYGSDLVETINLNDGLVYADKKDGNESGRYMGTLEGIYNDGAYNLENDSRTEGDTVKNYGLYTYGSDKDLGNIQGNTAGGFSGAENGDYGRKVFEGYFEALTKIKENTAIPLEKRKKMFTETFGKFEEKISNVIGINFERGKLGKSEMIKKIKAKGLDVYFLYEEKQKNIGKGKDEFYDDMFNNFTSFSIETETEPVAKTQYETSASIGQIVESQKSGKKFFGDRLKELNGDTDTNKRAEEILETA